MTGRRDDLQRYLKESKETFEQDAAVRPSRSAQFFAQTFAAYEKDSKQQAKLEVAEEIGELVDLRFIAPQAEGSIPLDWFVKVAEPLNRAWKLAAHRLRFGEVTGRPSREIDGMLNLKLAGMGYGSTRIFITGNGRPDLTGESLLRATLQQTFRLLKAPDDDFYDAVDAVGSKAAEQYGDAMKALDATGMAAEFTWVASFGMAERWDGRPAEIGRLRHLLEAVKDPERFEEEIVGVVASLKDTGLIHIRDEFGTRQPVRFPLALTPDVRRLTLHSDVKLRVATSRYWDAVLKRDVFKRQLIGVIDPSSPPTLLG